MPAHTPDVTTVDRGVTGKPRRPRGVPGRPPQVPVVVPRHQPRRIPGRR